MLLLIVDAWLPPSVRVFLFVESDFLRRGVSHLFSTFLESGEIACFAFLSPYVPFHGSRGRDVIPLGLYLLFGGYDDYARRTSSSKQFEWKRQSSPHLQGSAKHRFKCRVVPSTIFGWQSSKIARKNRSNSCSNTPPSLTCPKKRECRLIADILYPLSHCRLRTSRRLLLHRFLGAHRIFASWLHCVPSALL